MQQPQQQQQQTQAFWRQSLIPSLVLLICPNEQRVKMPELDKFVKQRTFLGGYNQHLWLMRQKFMMGVNWTPSNP
jgi:hypothetical protein